MGAIQINEKFKPLWLSDADYFLITGGRGSGKSFAVGDFIENLTFEKKQKILLSRYTLTSAEISVIPEFIEKIELENHIHNFIVNKTDIVNISTGSPILFRGLKTSSGNQTANLKSLQGLTCWVLEEAEELIDESIFDEITESIRVKNVKNRIIIILNPANKGHWIYERFFEKTGVKHNFNGEKIVQIGEHAIKTCYIHTSYLDNIPNLSSNFLAKAEWEKINRPERYKHKYVGEWSAAAEGIIFPNWKYGEFDTSLPSSYGLDFGFNDPDALVKVAIDHKKLKMYWDEKIYKEGNSFEDLRILISEHCNRNDLITADCADARMIAQLKKYFNIHPVNKTKWTVAEALKMMQDYEHIVTETSYNLAREFNNYLWNDKKAGVPIADFDHLIDAGRYRFQESFRVESHQVWRG
jgi:phage terminase large subunit